jgi:hypothetical protein
MCQQQCASTAIGHTFHELFTAAMQLLLLLQEALICKETT